MKLESGPKPDLLKGDTMLQRAHVATGLPVEDLHRARDFYAQRLGLEPTKNVQVGSSMAASRASSGRAASVCSASARLTLSSCPNSYQRERTENPRKVKGAK
jgi:Glyoxalase/Bleomycin resistance protein/Dioxygenase superfamily